MVEVNFECVFKRKFELFVMCYISKVGWIMPKHYEKFYPQKAHYLATRALKI